MLGFIIFIALAVDTLIEMGKSPLKYSRRGNTEAPKMGNRAQEIRQEEEKEVSKIHSIAWDAKTRQTEEIIYTEV